MGDDGYQNGSGKCKLFSWQPPFALTALCLKSILFCLCVATLLHCLARPNAVFSLAVPKRLACCTFPRRPQLLCRDKTSLVKTGSVDDSITLLTCLTAHPPAGRWQRCIDVRRILRQLAATDPTLSWIVYIYQARAPTCHVKASRLALILIPVATISFPISILYNVT